jgi:NhaA family Na+:H+ antiporter
MGAPGSAGEPRHGAAPPEAWEPLLRLARLAGRPLERFLRIEAASGIVLLLSAAAALLWANSAAGASYTRLWDTPIGVHLGSLRFARSLAWVVNDVLMVIFFFVVGLEIRRELHHGELSRWRRAALPAAAAIGGMVAPALLYLAVAGGAQTRSGWGVPMATDIAFAVSVLMLLGPRVPAALRVLLLALAIIDDLGAIVVIALFYTPGLKASGLLLAAAGVAGIFALRALGVRRKLMYVAPGFVVWAGVYASGVHPTIAGVVIGLLTPVRAWLGPERFREGLHRELERLEPDAPDLASPHELARTLRHVDEARREALSPAESLIENLHPWVAFGIMPLFALANAGVRVDRLALGAAPAQVVAAVAIGLVLGKPLGVLLASLLALRLRVASLPAGLGIHHLAVLGLVAGIGFTMALFIADLAFSEPELLGAAKIGVLCATALAGILALLVGRALPHPGLRAGIAATADEAECSTEA